jgi:NADH-quinone oxidoreductase subunit C
MTDATTETDTAEVDAAPAPEELHGAPVTWSRGQQIVHTTPDGYLSLIEALKADGFNMCIDVTAVDYLVNAERVLPDGIEPQRFELVVNLLSHAQRRRVRVRVQVPSEAPAVPSLFQLYPGTEAYEREVFDMFGITFDGHPDLTRILMPEEWEGHPLRKDYAMGRVPVQFKEAPAPR